MKSKFCKQRRDMLKGTATLAGATAVVALSGGVKTFAQSLDTEKGIPVAGDKLAYTGGPKKGQQVAVADIVAGARPVQAVALDPKTGKPRMHEGDSDKATVLIYRAAPDKIPADMKSMTTGGVMAYSAVCTHFGCILTDWNATKHWFQCPCHDATFDPLNDGENTGGARTRALPEVPIKAVNGKLVVAGQPTSYIGVKRGGMPG